MYGSRNPEGKVIYRCHRGEIAATPCGYWIAYEEKILPFLLKNFLDAVREEVLKAAASAEVIPLSDEGRAVRKELAALEARLDQARERYLAAPANLAKGLLAKLEEMEGRKCELEARLVKTAGESQTDRLRAWWENYQREFFAGCPIDVGATVPYEAIELNPDVWGRGEMPDTSGIAAPPLDGEYMLVVRTKIPASVLREKLKRLATKVSIWFIKKEKGRGYDPDKIRIEAYIDGQKCYEYDSNADS